MAGCAGRERGSGVIEREGVDLGHPDGARLDQIEDAHQMRRSRPTLGRSEITSSRGGSGAVGPEAMNAARPRA